MQSDSNVVDAKTNTRPESALIGWLHESSWSMLLRLALVVLYIS